MTTRRAYLDTFAFVRVARDQATAEAAHSYLKENDYELVIGTLNMLEIYPRPSCWSAVATFISGIPFCIAQNSDLIADAEVASYPRRISLPVGFRSSGHPFSRSELSEALEENLRSKISSFNRNFQSQHQATLEAILAKRTSFLPEAGAKYSPFQRWLFLQASVMNMLQPRHAAFLRRLAESKEVIQIECFRSVYIQALAIFIEYYLQKKPGKPSDVGDICQLALIPYVDLAVLDNERNNLIQRINRADLFPERLSSCRLSQFLDMIGRSC